MFGKKNNNEAADEKESAKTKERLDSDESISVCQAIKGRPGGAAVPTPNTIFLAEKRVIVRNPARPGLEGHIGGYHHRRITNIRLEKGPFSASSMFVIPGMTEISKPERKMTLRGRDS